MDSREEEQDNGAWQSLPRTGQPEAPGCTRLRYKGKMSPRQSKRAGDKKLRAGKLRRNHSNFLKTGCHLQMHQRCLSKESVPPWRGRSSRAACLPAVRAELTTKGLRFGYGEERSVLSAANPGCPSRQRSSQGMREASGVGAGAWLGRRGLPSYRRVQLRLSQLHRRSPRTSCQLRARRIAAPGPSRDLGRSVN